MLLNKGTLQSGSNREAPVVEEFEAGLSTSQMRAWTLRNTSFHRGVAVCSISSSELLDFIQILNWAGEWPGHSPQQRNTGLPHIKQTIQTEGKSQSECPLLPIHSLKRLLTSQSGRQKEDRDNLQPTWFQLGTSPTENTTEALSHYRGGKNTVSCKMLHLEIHFDSTLLNFTFLFISLFILVTSSCQTLVHPPLRPAPSPTEHLGSHDTPADVTQATKWTDFTHKDLFGRE